MTQRSWGCRGIAAAALAALLLTGSACDAAPSQPPRLESDSPTVIAQPTRILIPAIEVDAPVIRLDLEPDGSLQVPEDPWETGWFEGGPEPGEKGASVIAGHIDSATGPAVFYDLRDLVPGDEITVIGAAEEVLTFVVDRVQQYPKDQFPTDEVYGPTSRSELRLITCAGGFDRSTGHYDDNTVVYAFS
jgi:LPXTG-site transpeptidase (sortase) family protein